MATKTGKVSATIRLRKEDAAITSSDSRDTQKAAEEHDEWFREQVSLALQEADSPGAEWVTHDEAKSDWAELRAEFSKKVRARQS